MFKNSLNYKYAILNFLLGIKEDKKSLFLNYFFSETNLFFIVKFSEINLFFFFLSRFMSKVLKAKYFSLKNWVYYFPKRRRVMILSHNLFCIYLSHFQCIYHLLPFKKWILTPIIMDMCVLTPTIMDICESEWEDITERKRTQKEKEKEKEREARNILSFKSPLSPWENFA